MLLAALFQLIALAPRGFKPRQHKPHPMEADEAHKLWYFIDDHGDIVFPLIGLAVVALVIFGIRRGMTSNVAELHKKQEQKDNYNSIPGSAIVLNGVRQKRETDSNYSLI